MKILADTNILLDIVEHRIEFFKNSYAIAQLSTDEEIDCIVSASAITDVYYVTRRNSKDAGKAFDAIADISDLFHIVDTLAKDIQNAMSLPMSDFEDAVIATVAKREGADFIVTRNVEDFVASPVSAVTPEEFLVKWEGTLDALK